MPAVIGVSAAAAAVAAALVAVGCHLKKNKAEKMADLRAKERRFDANIASTLDMADDSLPPLALGNKVAGATHAESYGSL